MHVLGKRRDMPESIRESQLEEEVSLERSPSIPLGFATHQSEKETSTMRALLCQITAGQQFRSASLSAFTDFSRTVRHSGHWCLKTTGVVDKNTLGNQPVLSPIQPS